ncbi:hypothetical protein N9B89_00440 [Flavobacteriales bacterium]|jgi:hypothetical protein|nr:hypothetical protein [Flavobacteriales bacterium]
MKKLLLILLCMPLLFSCGGNLDKQLEYSTIMSGYTGKGTYSYEDGDKYIGEWKDGNKHGQGTFIWANGDKYIGEFKLQLRDGNGKFILLKEGLIQEGLWKEGEFLGE